MATEGAPASGADTGVDASVSSGQDSGASEGSANEAAAAREGAAGKETVGEKAERLKAKWFGKDHEATPAELRKMLSDDYEHEFRGPDGRSVKQNWKAIQRSVQLSEGAHDKMREAAAERQRYAELINWGKQNVPEFLSAHLGMDIEDLVIEHGRKMFERQQEYAKLSPMEQQRRMAQDAERKAEAKYAWERQQRERAEQARATKEAETRAESAVGAALSQRGMKATPKNIALAKSIFQEFSEVGYKITLDDLADMTVDRYRSDLLGELDGHDGEKLLELLGPERRQKLRELEMAAVKSDKDKAREAAKTQRQESRERPNTANGSGKRKGITEAEFNRMFRMGGQ
jgi:hypothetical protein